MPANALNTDRVISSSNAATPPIHIDLRTFSEGDRVVLRQGGAHVSIPVADLDAVIVAALQTSIERH